MPNLKLHTPRTDPTPIIDAYRGVYASQMLTACVAHLDVFGRLAEKPLLADRASRPPRPGIEAVRRR